MRCLLAIALICNVSAADSDNKPLKAPSFALLDLAGKTHRLQDYAGKVMVINFWASWCVPCREELPSMNRAAQQMRGQPVAWFALNVAEDREAVTAFTADFPIDFTVLLDPGGQASQDWQVIGMPTTFVVDREGYVAHKIVGSHEWDDRRHLRLVLDLVDE